MREFKAQNGKGATSLSPKLGGAKVLVFPNEFQKLLFMDASALGPNLSQLKDLNSQHSNSSPIKDCTDSCLFADTSAAPEDHDSQPHTLLITWFLFVPLQV